MAIKENDWFSVSREGLAELYKEKPKSFILRELIQNSFDERRDGSELVCNIKTTFDSAKKTAYISVEDNGVEGWKDLSDAYTLYKHSYKRGNVKLRGRFNLGEKQIFSICESAEIKTTKGTIYFSNDGRTEDRSKKTNSGTIVSIVLQMSKGEYGEMLSSAANYIIPDGISLILNGNKINSRKPIKEFAARLRTEIFENGSMRKTTEETTVSLYDRLSGKSWLYELGIPVCEIDCDYSIDVGQKIPLTIDRDSVLPSFLIELYGYVLNEMADSVADASASSAWVRSATVSKTINKETVEKVLRKRFGEKACVANNFDENSNDEAISKGYNLIYGGEMSSDEWKKINELGILETSSDLFGKDFSKSKIITELTTEMRIIKDYSERIAKKFLGIDIKVLFIEDDKTNVEADYSSNSKTLRFNLSLMRDMLDGSINEKITALIIHELSHEAGNHTNYNYQKMQANLGANLILEALKNKSFFDIRCDFDKAD